MKAAVLIFLIVSSVICIPDFSSYSYQSLKREAKLDRLWKTVIEDTESGKYPSPLQLGGIFLESMNPTIENFSDSLNIDRKKYIHSVGVVGKAKFVADPNSPYTGFFQGADSVLLRFSLAKNPDYSKPQAKNAFDNFVPGVALKYLIDHAPSANLVSMWGVNGVDTFNFFDKEMNTHIQPVKGLPLNLVATKFSTATPIVAAVGLSRFAIFNQDGSNVSTPKFPFKLTFKAPNDVKDKFTDDYTQAYQEVFSEFEVGTTILDVYATEDPKTGCEQKIGSLITTSEFTTSKFGDDRLFFQHQDYRNDLKFRPEWQDYVFDYKLFGKNKPKKEEGKCPFASFFNF